ncbi:MAG: prepilin-type N-terminal cleavage/methylation domain-containing protein [Proteobacteria bacterium]|jgi:type IV pilus assembly protein PilV|nr:prepilin-type N-terminal cleavage/methylation domain-containing protein [Pseudomonadota bacterium]MBU4413445.1 prepilin-type N-terminal cleavage/methylation domain-containing protein [Pseudomonadota bacterium]MDP2758774.1 prepilin-type N-terminal cleavage/methylation domain-containing protein [Desulfurivibrionaceae bacterium]PKN23164.1 MAG: hypothetical protein CVU68_02095 [Deltaproteobacteria bacterium HGW-Deltaproteobacteria-3]
MEPIALKTEEGFTLIEALVAMLILSVILLGALQGLMVSYRTSSTNTLRNEAVSIAEETGNALRNTPYTDLVNGTTVNVVTRQIANASAPFTVTQVVADSVASVAKSIQITISWTHQGQAITHTATIIVGNS